MSNHDLAQDAKAYQSKHIDELRAIQNNIDMEEKRPRGRYQSERDVKNEIKATVQPLINVVLSFIRNKGYKPDDTEDIIKALGFEIPANYIQFVKSGVNIALSQKQTKRQEVR